ncbi:hypothetical protein [Hungatella hathewayi]|uniref:hypothetical protein n=1 Tax=Hungatella hathewayi TaxID=154046 RepID=UPI0011DE565E|nr:hypothetical protein [Hungatella hathewayi]
MRKTSSFVLALAMALTLVACGNSHAPASSETGIDPPGKTVGQPSKAAPGSEASTEPSVFTDAPIPSGITPAIDEETDEKNVGSSSQLKPDGDTAAAIPEPARMDAAVLWEKLEGCWTAADERFAYFTYDDVGPAFLGGIWESEAVWRRGSGHVTELKAHSDQEYSIIICYPPVEDGNAADEQETREMYVTLELDIGRECVDETIRLNDADGVTRQYAWGGSSYDDAYDSVHDIQYATFEEMQSLWGGLIGCWNSEDGRFVVFDQMDSDTLLFREGVRNAGGGRGFGTFEKAMTSIGDIPIKFIVYYPAIGEENLLDGPLPELSRPVYLDITDLYTRGILHLKIGESGEWKLYKSAGADTDDSNQSTW